MDLANIFLTDPKVTEFAPFEDGKQHFVFHFLDTDLPDNLIDGDIWVFVDWVLPDISGLELTRRLRSAPQFHAAHVTLVLEAESEENSRRALDAGADDYMLAPITRHSALDRILAGQPSWRRTPADVIELGDLLIDLAALRARYAGSWLDLRPNEFRLLRYFAQNPNRVLSRETLIAGLGKQDPPIDSRTVDVWIGRLRQALRQASPVVPLRTVRSQGYVFDL